MTRNNFKPPAILLPHTIPQEICIAYEQALDVVCSPFGGVAERLNAPVLKTGDGRPSVGSNPTSSAIFKEKAQAVTCLGFFVSGISTDIDDNNGPGCPGAIFTLNGGLDPPLIAQGEAALTIGLAEEGEPLLHLFWQGRARFQTALKQVLAIGLQLEATAGLYRI